MSETQDAWVARVLGVNTATVGPPGGAGVEPRAAGAVIYAKSRLAWLAMRRKIETEVDDFIDSVAEQYEEEGNDQIVRDLLRARVTLVMTTFDDTLADALDEATNETNLDRRRALVARARTIIERYQAFVAGESLFAAMDKNPFATTAIQKTIAATLQTLSTSLR